MTTKTKTKSEPQVIAIKCNHDREGANSLYAFSTKLYRTDDGRWFFREFGGAAMHKRNQPRYVDRAEAVEWIATEANDVTGLGYTREQAEQMADGLDAGKGYRELD